MQVLLLRCWSLNNLCKYEQVPLLAPHSVAPLNCLDRLTLRPLIVPFMILIASTQSSCQLLWTLTDWWNMYQSDMRYHWMMFDHPWSSVVYNFGRFCTITFESLDVGNSYLHIRCISRGYGSSSYMKVIRQDQGHRSKKSRQPSSIPATETCVSAQIRIPAVWKFHRHNSASITQSGEVCVQHMILGYGRSNTSLLRDRK